MTAKEQTPAQRFIDSMVMTFDMWHDGTGYNLDALRAVPEGELPALEAMLIAKRPWDWRDIEALGVLNTPTACEAIRTALTDPDPRYAERRQIMSGLRRTVNGRNFFSKRLKPPVFLVDLARHSRKPPISIPRR
jgi:hypothetical protein